MRRLPSAAGLAVAVNLLVLASSLGWPAAPPRATAPSALAGAVAPEEPPRPRGALPQAACPVMGAAALAPAGDSGIAANVNTTPAPAGTAVDAVIINLQPGQAPLLVVPTTVGPE